MGIGTWSPSRFPKNDKLLWDGNNNDSNLILLLQMLSFFGFCTFEFCCGLFFPTMGSLKAQVVSEKARATIYSLFSTPSAIMICFMLSFDVFQFKAPYWYTYEEEKSDGEPRPETFSLSSAEKLLVCSFLLFIGFILMVCFANYCDEENTKKEEEEKEEGEEENVNIKEDKEAAAAVTPDDVFIQDDADANTDTGVNVEEDEARPL